MASIPAVNDQATQQINQQRPTQQKGVQMKGIKRISKLDLKPLLAVSVFTLGLASWSYAQEEQDIEIPIDSDRQYTPEDIPMPESENDDEWVEPQPDQAAMEAAEIVAKQMADIVDEYKLCLRAIISSDTPVAVKQQEIDTQCQAQRQQIVTTMPQDLQEFMLLNMDRRIDLVLRTMRDAEDAVDETVQDITEAVVELSTEDNP